MISAKYAVFFYSAKLLFLLMITIAIVHKVGGSVIHLVALFV